MKNGKSKDYLSVDGGVPSSIQKSRTGNCYFFFTTYKRSIIRSHRIQYRTLIIFYIMI